MSDELNLTRNILFYCVLAVQFFSKKMSNVFSCVLCCPVSHLIVMYVSFYKAVHLHSEVKFIFCVQHTM